MIDNLRDRIADAIFAAIPVTNEQAQRAAGTVMNHLGLTQAHAVEDRGGSKRKVTRYVTEWTTDE